MEKINGELKIIGVYKIINLINNKMYIGSSFFVQSRLRLHKSHLRKNMHCNKHLQSSFNKYGESSFEFVIIEQCSQENLIEREQYWIDKLDVCNPLFGYNIRLNAETNFGLKRSEETKKRISEAKKGKRYLSDNHYKKLGDSRRGVPNEGSKKYFENLSNEEKSKIGKRANVARLEKAEERGSYNTKEGQLSYKKKRGKRIYKYDSNYNLIEEFLTISDALKSLNMSPKNTSCITNQLDTNKIYKGFLWFSVEHIISNNNNESCELLETPEVDNQQPSIIEI